MDDDAAAAAEWLTGIAGRLLASLPPLLSLRFSVTFWAYVFWVLWIHRYVRLIVHCVSHWAYKSKPLPESPEFTEEDVTVVIPTIHNFFPDLEPSLSSILNCNPAKLILVTTSAKRDSLEDLAKSLSQRYPGRIRVLATDIANKRRQVCAALPEVATKITVMADDDVTWPRTMLPWILAPFQDASMGGVGTCQRVKRERSGPWATRAWNWLGAAYIERRNFEISATHNIDGGTSCMSGRTGAYRSSILQSPEFLEGFTNEKWRKWNLNADDDNFVTRWLVSNRWKTWIQYSHECELETTLENDHKFLYQCSRWARSNWRSNWTSLFRDRHVWRQQPWCTYALHIATFTSLAFAIDPLLLASCWWATGGWETRQRLCAFWAQFVFMFAFTKVVKLMGLFVRNPGDLVFLPVSIAFGYFHGLIKLYALWTLNMTAWGSRADGDTHDRVRMSPAQQSPTLKGPPGPDMTIPLYNTPGGRQASSRGGSAGSALEKHLGGHMPAAAFRQS
ncbi:hypothetical protein CDD83_3659 [Cordyceps sp. RAO-2017]|nr:hypothetical protein CDD83_3659 [Cordyceps sp. RAO-2017]